MGSIFGVLEWAKREGEVKAIARIRMRVLGDSVKEGVRLGDVKPDTRCSPQLLNKIRVAASEIVGKPCPV